jgi:hypothetical protein
VEAHSDAAPAPRPIDEVEFIEGPWAGEREVRSDLPATIAGPGGTYRRSVRCAEDGALRYVWQGPGSASARPGDEEA